MCRRQIRQCVRVVEPGVGVIALRCLDGFLQLRGRVIPHHVLGLQEAELLHLFHRGLFQFLLLLGFRRLLGVALVALLLRDIFVAREDFLCFCTGSLDVYSLYRT